MAGLMGSQSSLPGEDLSVRLEVGNEILSTGPMWVSMLLSVCACVVVMAAKVLPHPFSLEALGLLLLLLAMSGTQADCRRRGFGTERPSVTSQARAASRSP